VNEERASEGGIRERERQREIDRERERERDPVYCRVVPAHRNWQIETAVWNLAGFWNCALKPRWLRFGQFLHDFLNDFLHDFLCENLHILCENP